jgi:hypothetical protein
MYEYHTEAVSIPEKMVGRTTAATHGQSQGITDRFNLLAREGWEFQQMAGVPVIGKVKKSAERRLLTIAVFRRARN